MDLFKNGAISPVYVIHAKRFADRADHMKTQLGKHEIPFEFIEPYDAETLDARILNRFQDPASNLPLGSLSCALKHMEAIRRVAERDNSTGLIFEDDVILDKRFNQKLGAIWEESRNFTGPHTIQIGSGGNMFVPGRLLRRGKRIYKASEVRAADSYLINTAAARLRIQWLENKKISLPVDHLFNLMDKEMKIPIYWTEPTLVEQGSMNGVFYSAVDSRGKMPLWRVKLVFLWQRLRKKYLYRLIRLPFRAGTPS